MLMEKGKKIINYTAMRWNANIGSAFMLFYISVGLALISYCQLWNLHNYAVIYIDYMRLLYVCSSR